jgi:serine/threonine-protein kinase
VDHVTIGPYQVLDRLGAGGMGEVFLAVDTRLDRRVALKYLSDPALDVPHERDRLLREARAAAQITHPNIAAIYDVLDSGPHPCIVMEYAQGEPLSSVAARGPMDPRAVVAIGIQLADALAHAHAAGVIHRDLKPANIILTPSGAVKVLDFGVARVRNVETTGDADAPTREVHPLHTKLAGTPAYMAPEQLAGQPASTASDVYGLGATLFELVTGRRPFAGTTLPDVVYQILSQPTPRASAMNPAVPADLDEVVARAMARDTAQRYPSAAHLAEALRSVADAPTAAGGRTPSAGSSGDGLGLPRAAPWYRRSPVAAAAALAAVVGVAFTAHAMWPRWLALPTTSQFVVVLPFSTPAGDAALAAAAVGFSDSIVATIEGLSSVTVVSRTDAAGRFEPGSDTQKRARELGVTIVVSGQARRLGDRFQFSTSIGPPTGRAIASRSYVGPPAELSALEARAVRDVVSALNVSLTPADRDRLARAPACRADAYADYSRGQALIAREDLAGNAAEAVEAFTGATAKDPACARAHAGLSDALLAQYRASKDEDWVHKAEAAITRALALDPDNPAIRTSAARLYLDTGRAEAAERVLREVVAQRPRDDEPHRLLSVVLRSEGRKEEAAAELQRAIDRRPANVLNYVAQGNAAYDTGRYADAVQSFSRVLEIQPDNTWAIINLGAAYWMLGDRQKAFAVYGAAPAPDATILSNTGSFYLLEGKYEDAARALEQAVALAPQDDVKHRNLADTYLLLGQRPRALEQYRQAHDLTQALLRVNPRDAHVLARHALYVARIGVPADAVRHAREAVELAPDDNYVLYKAAVVNCLVGRRTDAAVWLRRAVERGYSRSSARSDPDLAPLLKLPGIEGLLRDET